uniref:F-box domain-containing protein n=1 Tax=Steinernema glaseri TaxID=37863 RepID=A0A1I7ZRC5_9BILA
METVPYAFVEQTIRLLCRSENFCSFRQLSSNWRRYAEQLYSTPRYYLFFKQGKSKLLYRIEDRSDEECSLEVLLQETPVIIEKIIIDYERHSDGKNYGVVAKKTASLLCRALQRNRMPPLIFPDYEHFVSFRKKKCNELMNQTLLTLLQAIPIIDTLDLMTTHSSTLSVVDSLTRWIGNILPTGVRQFALDCWHLPRSLHHTVLDFVDLPQFRRVEFKVPLEEQSFYKRVLEKIIKYIKENEIPQYFSEAVYLTYSSYTRDLVQVLTEEPLPLEDPDTELTVMKYSVYLMESTAEDELTLSYSLAGEFSR